MTKSSKFSLLIATLSVAIPQAAAAQTDADAWTLELSRKDAEYLRSVRPFADCLVAHRAQEIPKFLGDPDQSVWIGRDMSKHHPECPRPKSSDEKTTFFLQGAILEALIRRDFSNVDAPPTFDRIPPLVYVKDTDNKYIKQDTALLIEPYDCTARRAPAKVQAFLRTEPLSTAEAAAFAGLKDALTACHPKGEKWDLRPYFARRYLAETFYTLMKVNQRATAGTR